MTESLRHTAQVGAGWRRWCREAAAARSRRSRARRKAPLAGGIATDEPPGMTTTVLASLRLMLATNS